MKPIQSGLLSLTVPKFSFYMITVPKVSLLVMSTGQTVIPVQSMADATLGGGSQGKQAYGTNSTLLVSSSNQVYATLVKFDANSTNEIVSAVLQLTLLHATNTRPQVLTILGVDSDWNETTVSWNDIDALKPDAQPPTTAYDNFIQWGSERPRIVVVGHMTVPPGSLIQAHGVNMRLDVTDCLKRERRSSFLVVRMKRHDASMAHTAAQLPADIVQGVYTFASKESLVDSQRPQLLIQYQQ